MNMGTQWLVVEIESEANGFIAGARCSQVSVVAYSIYEWMADCISLKLSDWGLLWVVLLFLEFYTIV